MNLHIALTGGIGTGKSTAAAMLVARGAHLIDADGLARQVVEPGTPALEQIRETFGAAVITDAGTLDRPALAELVFASAERLTALNSIVHPAIRRASAQQKGEILASDPLAVIVEDIPLLSSPGEAGRFHGVIVIHTPLALRLQRLQTRGMTIEDARARIEAQATDEERFLIADARLANDAGLEHLERQVDQLWRERLTPYRDALHGKIPPPVPRPGTEDELRRARARLKRAGDDAGLDLDVIARAGALELGTGTRDPAELLLTAGFVHVAGRTHVCADPGAPVPLTLR